MRAMILAAGRGDRMRPLTDHCPKPLLEVGGKPLIVWHLENIQRAGINDVIINVSYLAEQIKSTLGDGSAFGLNIRYSDEQPSPLETLGGILRALPLLGETPFLLVNGDIWTDFPMYKLRRLKVEQAHLLLTSNPSHHPQGDFSLDGAHLRHPQVDTETLTYTGIGVFHPNFFIGQQDSGQPLPLAPLLFAKANQGLITAEHIQHQWIDVGTPERIEWLNETLSTK